MLAGEGEVQGSLNDSSGLLARVIRLLRRLRAFQTAKSLPATGKVDDVTWQALMQRPIPGTDLRSLELTAAFEGHGYTLAQGNWDGAWLTWGVIGFTQSTTPSKESRSSLGPSPALWPSQPGSPPISSVLQHLARPKTT